jgi:hypothetical protein
MMEGPEIRPHYESRQAHKAGSEPHPPCCFRSVIYIYRDDCSRREWNAVQRVTPPRMPADIIKLFDILYHKV